jgi:hypothetical protein
MNNCMQETIETQLLNRHGSIIRGSDLWKEMGFSSYEAFRQSERRGKLGITLFTIPDRNGKFAITCEVAHWIVEHRENAKQA